ncbi:MAG: hypothetical protein V1934_09155 [Methanobacteriota archaeon]
MEKKKTIGAVLALALLFSSIGMIAAAQAATDDGAGDTGAVEVTAGEQGNETTELRVLITMEQRAAMSAVVDEMRAANVTHDDIMAEIDAMTRDYMAQNLESYGVAEADSAKILDAIDDIDAMEQEIRDTAEELRELGLNRREIRNQTQPMLDEMRTMRTGLADLLAQYDILPPMCGPAGPGMMPRQGFGQNGTGCMGPQGREGNGPQGMGGMGGMRPGRPIPPNGNCTGRQGFEP